LRCEGGHSLEKGVAPSSGLVCDVCNGRLRENDAVFSCRACNYDCCTRCAYGPISLEDIRARKMVQRLEGYSKQAQAYADAEKRRTAIEALPRRLAPGSGAAATARDGALLGDVLRWFKEEFFRWTDRPKCSRCGVAATESAGMAPASDEELRYGATRVEAWRCGTCQEVARFPRYNDPARLLETRNGRCGEWANCFTLITAALGYDCRLVLDWTDHVWTEVRLDDRWVHCDPCEGCLDAPLMYEAGWGKKLTYIVAFSPTEVVDVTPRYTAAWPQVLSRRRQVTEDRMSELVAEADQQVRSGSQVHTPAWRDAEVAELSLRCSSAPAGGAPSAAELQGRTSGSASWRLERGELGSALPVVITREAPASLAVDARVTDLAAEHTHPETGHRTHARLVGGAAVASADGAACIDLTADGAAVEIAEDEQTADLGDALLSPTGFTVEAWVLADPSKLNVEAHRNPVASRHGPASGWELRLRRDGGAIFLVTVGGQHIEVASAPCEGRWSRGWCHVAGTLEGPAMRLFVGGRLEAEAEVPAGDRSSFPGPTCLGRNPAWRDRGFRCRLRSARVTHAALQPGAFLQ